MASTPARRKTSLIANDPDPSTGFPFPSYRELDGSFIVEVAHSPTFEVSDLTVECWIRPTTLVPDSGAYQESVSYGSPSTPPDQSWVLQILGNELVADAATIYLVGKTPLFDGVTYHVARTYDSATKTLSLYVNGNLDTTGSESNASFYYDHVNGGGGGIQAFSGVIDEVATYPRALDQATLQCHDVAGASGR